MRSEELARIELRDAAATEAIGEALGRRLRVGQALGLVGELGAGKTTLARGVAIGLEVKDPSAVASPTYLLLVEHPGARPMVHVDAYLPDKARAFLADGGVDYLAEAPGVLVVEWADRLAQFLPTETLWVKLAGTETGGRECAISGDPAVFGWCRELA